MKKEDINYVFEQNPGLASIGTKTQYYKYLQTIFPESKVKNTVYHQTPKKFEEFNLDKSRTGGIYFSPYNRRALLWDKTIHSLIDIQNPLIISKKQNKNFERYLPNIKKLSKKVNLGKYDGIIGFSNVFYDKGQLDSEIIDVSPSKKNNIELVAFDPKQIHILGSKKDISGFKEFVSKVQSGSSLEDKLISGFFILSFIAGLLLISPNITGNIIGSRLNNSNFLGISLILFGILGVFISKKFKKKIKQ